MATRARQRRPATVIQRRLVSRIHERNRYFYRVEEQVGSPVGVGRVFVYISQKHDENKHHAGVSYLVGTRYGRGAD